MSDDKYADLRRWAEYRIQRTERARGRQEAEEFRSTWYFGLVGLKSSVDDFRFSGGTRLKRLVEPPEPQEFEAAIQHRSIAGSVSRYKFTHELAIDWGDTAEHAYLTAAYWSVTLFRLRSGGSILVPAYADRSWDHIAAVTDGSCVMRLLEDVPKAHFFPATAPLDGHDLEWVDSNWTKTGLLYNADARFSVALDAYTSHHLQESPRMVCASVWAGLEAIVGAQTETTFRLALYLSAMLEQQGPARLEMFRRLTKEYAVRSLAVHGGRLSPTKIQSNILYARELLRRLLIWLIERGTVPSKEEVERLLLTNE